MLNKLVTKLQGEVKSYAVKAVQNPSKRDAFEYGSHHGYLKALDHVEQWINELLEEEGDDEGK